MHIPNFPSHPAKYNQNRRKFVSEVVLAYKGKQRAAGGDLWKRSNNWSKGDRIILIMCLLTYNTRNEKAGSFSG